MSEEQKPYDIVVYHNIFSDKKVKLELCKKRIMDNEIEKINIRIDFHQKAIDKLKEEKERLHLKYCINDYT